MKMRYYRAYFRQTDRTYAFVGTLMKKWGSTGYKDYCADQKIADWWEQWFSVGTGMICGITPRSLFRRLRANDKAARRLPTDYFGM